MSRIMTELRCTCKKGCSMLIEMARRRNFRSIREKSKKFGINFQHMSEHKELFILYHANKLYLLKKVVIFFVACSLQMSPWQESLREENGYSSCKY